MWRVLKWMTYSIDLQIKKYKYCYAIINRWWHFFIFFFVGQINNITPRKKTIIIYTCILNWQVLFFIFLTTIFLLVLNFLYINASAFFSDCRTRWRPLDVIKLKYCYFTFCKSQFAMISHDTLIASKLNDLIFIHRSHLILCV